MSTSSEAPLPRAPASSSSQRWKAEMRATFALAWPLVIAQLASNAIQTTDVIMMGWLGPTHLAAGALASSFMMPIVLLGIGIAGATAPLIAQARGARQIRAIRRIARQGFWVALVLAAFIIPVILQIRPVLTMLEQPPEAVALAAQYAQIAAFSFLPQLLVMVPRSLLSVYSMTRVILVVTVGGVVVNAIFNYLFIFGNFGFPRLELVGAAITTIITHSLMFLALLVYVVRHPRLSRFHILIRFWKPDWARFIEIFRIGTPIGLTILAEVALFSGATFLMGRLGTAEVAAHAVALQCASLAFMIPLGIGMAATVRVGIAYGAGDREGIGRAGWVGIVVGSGFMVLTALLFLTAGPLLVRVFLDPADPQNTHVLGLAATYLIVAGIFQLVDGAQVVAAHALRGLSDTAMPMVIALVGYWAVGMPVAYLLGFVFELRGVGIWIGLAVGLACAALALVTRFAMRERLGLTRTVQI